MGQNTIDLSEVTMMTKEETNRFAEEHFVEAYANLAECNCAEEHRLHVALSETRARPIVYAPEHIGIKGARCATFGRCREGFEHSSSSDRIMNE
jgi:hypothetical protein